MNSSKAIDISKSSLVGLKAELLKKQEEVKKLKEIHKDSVKPVPQPKTSKASQKLNKGVEERIQKDAEQTEEDFDLSQKSRQLLEAKSKLYDKLKANKGTDTAKTQYLIDFDLKQELYSNEKHVNEEKGNTLQLSEEEDVYSDSNSDPENDWVDFVDTLGRSRRCLKKDLPDMKMKDAKFAASLRPPTPPPVAEPSAELLSWDMQREMMRKKWEEQETLLLGKQDVHYQDVLYDEARPHGVGYFGFSTEESERLRQQQELNNMRKETLEQQEAAVGLRVRRQQQLEARLAAARRRKRERMGLPPEEPEAPPEAEVNISIPEEEQQPTPERIEDLEESIKKIAPVRPWDIGKLDANSVMTQDEWIEKKRSERPQEFAPPISCSRPREISGLKNHKPTESGFIERSLHSQDKTAFATNTELFQKVSKKEVFQSKHKNKDFHCDNTSNKYVGESPSKEYHTVKNKPTSEDIEELLKKTREKIQTQNEGIRQDEINTRDYSYNTATFPKVSKIRNSNTLNKTPLYSHNLPSFSRTHKKIDQDVMTQESGSQITEKHTTDSNITAGDDSFGTFLSNNNRKRGAEIPPPTCMSYYNDGPSSNKQRAASKTDLLESISVGLNFLKSKEQKKTRVKGLLDII